ncbi:citrate lyase subunit beta / citryl-CoA lyase [Paracoccus pantotrophus]|nr:citrate lyase subunit beta / citryl-CoA lyase [Paracoccus pantotrophus]
MVEALSTITAPLFVPASRPERVAKAAASGADAIIIDLEDAVAPADKQAARDALAGLALPDFPVILRINAIGTPWHEGDLALAARIGLAGIMLPKSEDAAQTQVVHQAAGHAVLALVETARGIANLPAIAAAPGVARLVFGSVDFSADIGCAHEPEPLLLARSQMVLASRVAGLAAPIDGVTLAIEDEAAVEAAVEADARRAVSLGFSGKLCIHPRQVAPVLRGFAPSAAEVEWAARVVAADRGGAAMVDGAMIDPPVRMRAEQILRRSGRKDGVNHV